MRGKAARTPHDMPRRRITPAYAGKSRSPWFSLRVSWDHPRLCGEKRNAAAHCVSGVGSPPPMRGKDTSSWSTSMPYGITPAYAGKRQSTVPTARRWWDHPRLCGEKFLSALALDLPKGSPPPMRGKGSVVYRDAGAGRITPAYAGKSMQFVSP